MSQGEAAEPGYAQTLEFCPNTPSTYQWVSERQETQHCIPVSSPGVSWWPDLVKPALIDVSSGTLLG